MRSTECYKCRQTVVWYSIFVNMFQASFKGILGILSGSSALVADGLHSSADVISSLVTMASIKISSRPPNEQYAYGFGRIQFISASIVGLILGAGAIYLFAGACLNIINDHYPPPNRIAMVGALVSIILNDLLFRYQSCVGEENNSPAIMSSAWDNRSDALSSVAVLIGIIFSTFGYPIADPLAAMGVSLMIFKIALELITDSYDGLMDHSPDIAELHDVYYAAENVPGVRGILWQKTRRHGEMTFIDIGIKVDPRLKIFEGDLIALAVKDRIAKVKDQSEIQVFLGEATH
ncbi:MAG: magnetosome biogenesis CDF transporter MamB [SAR324 cluster bacterium]|nr:magnetosome biogenesis CDF transporter MamB [SAR324 cluster bacterium]